jgi:hypothetical protein
MLTIATSIQCRTSFRKSSKPLPKPLKPPLIGYVIAGVQDSTPGLSQNLPEAKIDLRTAISDRRCYRNVNIYITELPPTPTRFRDKYHRGYEGASLPVQESITSLQRVGETPPKVQVLETPLLKDTCPLPPIPVLITNPVLFPKYHRPRVAHSVVMRPVDTGLHVMKGSASVGPANWIVNWPYPTRSKKSPVAQKKNNTIVPKDSGIPLRFSPHLWRLLHPFLGREELLALICACKRLRSVIEQYLYEDIRWTDSESDGFLQHKPRICLLLRSILHRPQLAGHVKHISLMSYDKTRTLHLAGSFATSEMKLAESFTKRARIFPENLLLEGLRSGSCDAMLALLLSLLWKLETLRITLVLPDDGNQCFVGNILQLNPFRINGHRSLDRLRTIEVTADRVERRRLTNSISEFRQQIHSLFALPNLESVTLTGFRPSAFQNIWENRIKSVRLTTLKIKNSLIDERALEQLLTALSPNLEILDCDFYDYPVRDSFDCVTLTNALQKVHRSLDSLAISLTIMTSGSPPGMYWIRRSIGKLTDYTCLRHASEEA